ncbi:hypothetical protein SAMN02745220_03985 [Desulfopila aestuarii DSM 18488]|uniref:Uncharacterized protein n=1 Tax=Desulfopila aestuarii DSM 18488 TaxID=1121416 RepID=A0A1M7YFR1_9BACT|nr:hypothetical protein SAMN02745220_03985 [Desulfopila aestuarii DSM 18488]
MPKNPFIPRMAIVCHSFMRLSGQKRSANKNCFLPMANRLYLSESSHNQYHEVKTRSL